MDDSELLERAHFWIAEDPDPETRRIAREMVDASDISRIRDHFGYRLEFGTAGLRGPLGPGPNRMNRALVRRVAAALGRYVGTQLEDAAERGVVVGYDGRHGSREFAEDTARVIGGMGIRVHVWETVVPTPLLAHSVPYLGAAAGVMVTASHNPPADNGYKVYWCDGAQIVPPHDRAISAEIERVRSLSDVEVADLDALVANGVVRPVEEGVLEHYVDEVLALRVHHRAGVRAVYTAMHGVGAAVLRRVLKRAGHTDLHLVPEQSEPDPDFPTVSFPNPEEPGALDLAKELARTVKADLIVAHDPDADRLAVAVPDGEGGFRQLTGNQVGALLGDDLLANGWKEEPQRLVATTIVSSPLLSRLAKEYGAAYEETLTGFKWIAEHAINWDENVGQFVMGYEEALGYSAGSVVRDKDGISALLLILDLAALCRTEGRTLVDQLVGIYRRHGLHVSRQKSVTLPGAEGAARITSIMDGLRRRTPEAIAGRKVVEVRDYLAQMGTEIETGHQVRLELPKSNVLAFDLEDGSRVLARPSGTEPKIKFYFEIRSPMGADETLRAAEARVSPEMDALIEDFLGKAGV